MATHDAIETTQTFPTGTFRQMGWAFLFLGISVGPSFRLKNENFLIDLLPDFIGYLMIATAANRLIPFYRRARGTRNLALLLTYLAIPTVIQYSVVTSQSGSITTWKAPFWPLAATLGFLELVLVWMLCGLVADLARDAGDDMTERRAYSRRFAYVFFKILLFCGLALVLLSPSPTLIIFGAIAAVVIGLSLLGLMMGLMMRAERLWAERLEATLTPMGPAGNFRPGGWIYRLLVIGGVLLPVALAAGAVWYYREWDDLRLAEMQKASSSAYFSPARDAFRAPLLAGQIEQAYAATTANFKARISRDQLAELARKYADYMNRREKDRGASGAGSSLGNEYLTEYEYIELEKGKVLQVTMTIRGDPDSILFRKPPPPKVDDFTVEEKATQDHQWPKSGNPLGQGQ